MGIGGFISLIILAILGKKLLFVLAFLVSSI